MTTREIIARAKVNQYAEYADNVNVHQKPIEGIHSGAHGISYEMAVKVELKNFRFKGNAAKAGYTDTTKKVDGEKTTFEIKSGCGELATLDENGDIINSIFSKDYVIYCPDYRPYDNVRAGSYILTGENFQKAVDTAGMARLKKSTSMTKKDKDEQYYDRMTLQSFSNSNRKFNLWLDALEEYGETLGSWLEKRGL